jgi:hypothetical protein
MTNFLFSNYLGLDDNQVVKIKLNGQNEILFGRIISVGGVQSYQPNWTPENAADLDVIKDLDAYKIDKNLLDNFYSKRLYINEIESIEIVDIN